MTHLNQALSLIRTHFNNTWVAGFSSAIILDDIDDDQNKLTAQVALLTVLNVAADKFYKELNFSVISGEYVEDLIAAEANIDSLDTLISSVANFDVPGFPKMLVFYQQVFTEAFLQPARKSLLQYKSLIKLVERHISHQPGASMIFHEIKDDKGTVSAFDSSATTLSELFQINVSISEIDHAIGYKKETFKRLLLLQNKLSKLALTGAELDIITAKCGFLLYKISYRLNQSKKKFDYVIDFNYSTVQLTEIPQFAYYTDIIKGHYGNDTSLQSYNQRAILSQAKFDTNGSTLDLDEYHSLAKKYKDTDKDITLLSNLKTQYTLSYNQRALTAISDYDKRAYDINTCYIENNLFSLELEKKQLNLKNWETKLQGYTTKALSLNNSNFFPYYKIISEFLIPQIDKQFEINDEDSLSIIKGLLEKYEENLNQLTLNTGICEETDYIAFQADYQTALTNITVSSGTIHKCFVSSAFILPLEYSKYKEELDTYKSKLTKFNAMYDIQVLLQNDHKTIQDVKEDIEKTDKRHIEILSIFAALVMFVSSEIQIFSKIVDMRDAAAFTLFFAYGFGVFVLMIWFITRPKGLKMNSFTTMHYFIIAFFCIGLLSGILYINKDAPEKSEEQKKLEKLNYDIQIMQKQKILEDLKKSKNKLAPAFSKPVAKKDG